MKKRGPLLVAALMGGLVHLGFIFYLHNSKVELLSPKRAGMIGMQVKEKAPQPLQEQEAEREEIMHAFFSSLAPAEEWTEETLSSPEPEEVSDNIDGPEVMEEASSLLTANIEALPAEQPKISPESFTEEVALSIPSQLPPVGQIFSEELLDNPTLEGIAIGLEDTIDSSSVDLVPQAVSVTPSLFQQGAALLQASSEEAMRDWESQLLASAEEGIPRSSFLRTGETLPNSQSFHTKVEYYQRAEGEYLFRIYLIPKEGKKFKRVKQNLFFLLDRSNSVDRKHYYAARNAIASSLSLLHPDDHFNIIVFDDELKTFAKDPVAVSDQSIQEAREFLEKESHGGFFAATDLYRSLDQIVPQIDDTFTVNTALLLSDGDTFLSLDKQRRTIGKWTARNNGKVSLFSFAIGEKNNLPLLDVISSFNRGVLIQSPSTEALPAVLNNFLASIRYPLGRDFRATAVPNSTQLQATLYPKNDRLPFFYEGIPYVLYGTVNQLGDFSLFLQGRHEKNWFDIQIPISFDQASQADSSILQEVAIQEAYSLYEQFLKTGNIYALVRAEALLEPFEIETAFKVR